MCLPTELPKAHVLTTVKTYPLPSGKYGELVCTAGLLSGEKWVRIYPIPLKLLSNDEGFPKYSWIELDLVRDTKDFRPESYGPRHGIEEDIRVIDKIGTARGWTARKHYVLKEVFTSMDELIDLAKSEKKKSLATLKPVEIVDFVIEEEKREWKEGWLAQSKQGNIFEVDSKGRMKDRHLIRKLPYRYSYKFLSQGDIKPRKLKIEDWEIGALFWNCLKQTDGNEIEANRLVRRNCFDTFREEKDLYFFLGTTKQFHNVAPNPFFIIGLFYPPKTRQLSFLQ